MTWKHTTRDYTVTDTTSASNRYTQLCDYVHMTMTLGRCEKIVLSPELFPASWTNKETIKLVIGCMYKFAKMKPITLHDQYALMEYVGEVQNQAVNGYYEDLEWLKSRDKKDNNNTKSWKGKRDK